MNHFHTLFLKKIRFVSFVVLIVFEKTAFKKKEGEGAQYDSRNTTHIATGIN
jgi:hypothetical protein